MGSSEILLVAERHLTFEERAALEERIERGFDSHREWPVELYLRKSAALGRIRPDGHL